MSSFIKEALIEAREARGLSVNELAMTIGVQRQTVHRWENGDAIPSPTRVSELAGFLEVPPRFFHTSSGPMSLAPVFFRSLTSVRKAAEVRKARRRLNWLRDLVKSLEPLVEFPTADLPRWRAVSDPRDLREREIEEAAAAIRRHWKLGNGAIPIVTRLLDNAGIIVSQDDLGAIAIDAFSQHGEEGGRPLVILAREDVSGPHIQADCAHELGHLVLHGWIDRRYIEDREQHRDQYKLIERQAWRFARAFLLPADTFHATVRRVSLDELAQLKLSWHVSVALMLKRCEDIGLIGQDELQQLHIRRQGRRWTKQEPFDSAISSEPPRLLTEAVEAVLEAGGGLARDWLSGLRIGPKDIASLAGIPRDAIETAQTTPVVRPRLKVAHETS